MVHLVRLADIFSVVLVALLMVLIMMLMLWMIVSVVSHYDADVSVSKHVKYALWQSFGSNVTQPVWCVIWPDFSFFCCPLTELLSICGATT